MGVPTSEVGYTIATTRRETTKVHKNMWRHWGEIYIYIIFLKLISFYELVRLPDDGRNTLQLTQLTVLCVTWTANSIQIGQTLRDGQYYIKIVSACSNHWNFRG